MEVRDDIARMTYGLRDNAKDLFDIWMHMPGRRTDFGPRELLDIRETTIALQVLLREIDKQSALKVVAR
jgi:hypothetical protein